MRRVQVALEGARQVGATARRARANWRVMYGYVRPHRLALLAGAVLSLLTGATGLALPLVVRGLISDLGQHRSVTIVLGRMTVLVVANAALGAGGGYALRRA